MNIVLSNRPLISTNQTLIDSRSCQSGNISGVDAPTDYRRFGDLLGRLLLRLTAVGIVKGHVIDSVGVSSATQAQHTKHVLLVHAICVNATVPRLKTSMFSHDLV